MVLCYTVALVGGMYLWKRRYELIKVPCHIFRMAELQILKNKGISVMGFILFTPDEVVGDPDIVVEVEEKGVKF
jgi:hypothetical protein